MIPNPHIPERPTEVEKEGIEKAGFRCEKLLRHEAATAKVPVIFYTVTNETHFADDLRGANSDRRNLGLPEVVFLGKEPDLGTLTDAVWERLA